MAPRSTSMPIRARASIASGARWSFNYGRNEVRSFLFSSALFWLEEFHLDGLRVDAVASMLYLDYSRNEGEWIPNQFGGRENLEAVSFLQQLNTLTHGERARDDHRSRRNRPRGPRSAVPSTSAGSGFSYKWNMGWMHDMLQYIKEDPVHRRWHHNEITFSMLYAFTENFILPFSHDEVVHGKRAMLDKMPGDVWQKHATLRTLYGYMFGHPGKKLMFMGWRVRAVARVELRREPRLASAGGTDARRSCAMGAGSQRHLSARAVAPPG